MARRAVKSARSTIAAMFRALDARDLDGFLAFFEPGASIVHDDGSETSARVFVRGLRARPSFPADRRVLRWLREGGGGGWRWVAYLNQPTFSDMGTLSFAETAILRQRAGRWRLTRVHYSGRRTPRG